MKISMFNPQIDKYLQTNKNNNLLFENFEQDLIKGGWNQDQINSARSYYSQLRAVQPQVLEMQQSTVMMQNNNDSEKKVSKITKIIKVFFLVLMLFLAFGSITVYAFAYFITTKKLNVENLFLKQISNRIILATPFITPKPELILSSVALAHQGNLKNKIDFSLAASSNDFVSVIESDKVDFLIKGYTDFTDPKVPRFDLNASITKQFNLDLKKNDKNIYLKVNQLPKLLTQIFISNNESIERELDNWIVYDPTPLESEAQNYLQENKEAKSPTDDAMNKVVENLLIDLVLPEIDVTNDTLDGVSTYKLSFKPSDQLFDKIVKQIGEKSEEYKNVLGASTSSVEKNFGEYGKVLSANTSYLKTDIKEYNPSDFIKDFTFSMWVDKSKYYARKSLIMFTVKAPESYRDNSISIGISPVDFNSEMTVVAVLKLSDFGVAEEIELPDSAVTPEDFMAKIMKGSIAESQFQKARDTQKRADLYSITNAIYQFAAEHDGILPNTTDAQFPQNSTCIGTAKNCFNLGVAGYQNKDTIIPTYISIIPIDPVSGTTENTGYYIFKDSNGRIEASAVGEIEPIIKVTR